MPVHGRVNLGVTQADFGFLELGLGVGQLSARGLHRAGGRVRLVRVGDRRIQIGLSRAHLVFQRLHRRQLRLQIAFRLHPVLIGGDPLFRQLDHAAAVTFGALQRGFRLQQLGAGRLQPGLSVHHVARSRPVGRLAGGLGRGNLRTQAVNHGGGGAGFGFQFRGIENRDQISLFDLRAFVHQQLRDPSLYLRADDDLVRIHRADQHQVAGARGGKQVVDRRRDQNHAEQDQKFVARVQIRAPSEVACRRNNAAEMKSITAARRAAILSGAKGSMRPITRNTGALVK